MSIKVEKITEPVIVAESPQWDERLQCLYYVSIDDNEIHKYVLATGDHTKTTLDGHVGFLVPVEGTTDQFVVGVERSFLLVRWDGAEGSKVTVLKKLGEVDQDLPKNRINDGKADPRGRLFGGTLGHITPQFEFEPERGSLYRFDSNKGSQIEKVVSGVTLSNGLTWDLNEKAFYYIDSMERKVRRYDYDVETGEFSNLTYVFDFKEHGFEGFPDGMTIDTDGNLWVAAFGESCVLKINPRNGEILLKVPIPAQQVTSVTFGGPSFDVLFVTTAKLKIGEVEQLPPSGSTFIVTGLGVKGHPNNKFKL